MSVAVMHSRGIMHFLQDARILIKKSLLACGVVLEKQLPKSKQKYVNPPLVCLYKTSMQIYCRRRAWGYTMVVH